MIAKLDWYGLIIFVVTKLLLIESRNITVGYLTAVSGFEVMNRQGAIASGALSYALHNINNNASILPDIHINMIWAPTDGSVTHNTRALTNQWRNGAVAYFGPEGSCNVEATIAAAWKLPMITYKCSDYTVSDKSKFPTFARTEPPDIQIVGSALAVLNNFNWTIFTIVHVNSLSSSKITEILKEKAISEEYGKMTVNIVSYSEALTAAVQNPFPKIVEDTFLTTRVYVFSGSMNSLVEFLLELYYRGLLDTGEYVVIYLTTETYNPKEPVKFFTRTSDIIKTVPNDTNNAEAAHWLIVGAEAAQSLIVICSSPAHNTPENVNFSEIVNWYLKEEPFEFFAKFPKAMSVYSYYLYDSVILYAEALHDVIKEGSNETDGVAIINKIRNKRYKSIHGYYVSMDENGDAKGNYTVLARQWKPNNASNYSMVPVGIIVDDDMRFQPIENVIIEWIRGHPPKDQPNCGFDGEKCKPDKGAIS